MNTKIIKRIIIIVSVGLTLLTILFFIDNYNKNYENLEKESNQKIQDLINDIDRTDQPVLDARYHR